MKKSGYILIILVVFLWVSCKNKNPNICKESPEQKRMDSIVQEILHTDWKVLGTEPFWNINVYNDTFQFSILNNNIDTVYFELKKYAKTGSVIEYLLTDEEDNTSALSLKEEQCSDGMSDKKYQYSATFKYKKLDLKGCAEMK